MSDHCMYPVWDGRSYRFCRRRPDSDAIADFHLCFQHEARLLDVVRWHDEKCDRERDERRQAARDEMAGAERDRIEAAEANRIVYYVQRPDGAIKIGTTRNLRARLQSLRNVSLVEVLATHPGGYEAEKQMHKKFAVARLHGEWFRPSTPLLRHIERLNSKRVAA